MPVTTNKQQFLNLIFSTLKKRYEIEDEAESRPLLDHVVYAFLREGTTKEAADAAFANLKPPAFIDWNEVRVSTIQELEEAFAELPSPGVRAEKIVGVLQYWFEMTYSFDMEEVAETAKKKGLKEGTKKLARLPDVNDFIISWVVQHGFGGHAVPLDGMAIRVLRRLGVIEADAEDLEALRASLEHYVPKARGRVFFELLSEHAHQICTEEPQCPTCPLQSDCPVGQEYKQVAPPPKPRKSR